MGSVIPMLIFHLSDAGTRSGMFTWISLAVILLGLALLARAGALKSTEQHAPHTGLSALHVKRTKERKESSLAFDAH